MLSRLKLSQRLWLASLFPLLAVTFLSFQYYRQTVETGLDVSNRQLEALPVLKDLRHLLQQVEQQRSDILLAIEDDQRDLQDEIQSREIESLLGELARPMVTSAFASAIWPVTRDQLLEIVKARRENRQIGFQAYTDVIDGILRQIDVVGARSNFAAGVDRSVDLHVLLADLLPHLVDGISLMRGLAVYSLYVGDQSKAETAKLSGRLSLGSYRFALVHEKIAGVKEISPTFAARIAESYEAFGRDFAAFREKIRDVTEKDLKPDPKEVMALGQAAEKHAYELIDRTFEEVDGIIRARVETHKARLASALAIGIFSVLASAVVVILTIATFSRSTTALLSVTERIAEGDRSIAFAPPAGRDELSVLGRGIERMYRAIRETEGEIRREADRKQMLADLGSRLQNESDPAGLARAFLTALADGMGLLVGAVSLRGEHGLARVAGYPEGGDAEPFVESPAFGSLLTETIRQTRPITVTDLALRASRGTASSLVRFLPETLIIAPLTFEGETLGVVEAGFMDSGDKMRLPWLEQTANVLATRLRSALAGAKLQQLYDQTKLQAAELEQRRIELETANQDLEQKTQELEQQQLELETTNQRLDQQRITVEDKNAVVEAAHRELEVAKSEIERKAADVEQASRYKSEFLANMSHELRSPLNSILVFSEILAKNQRSALTSKEVEYAQAINSSGTDLLSLIEDILDLSKVEAGHLEIRPEAFAVGDLIATLERGSRTSIEKKGIAFVVEVDPELPATWVSDQKRIIQIARNFLANATKFTESGSITLRIGPPRASAQSDGPLPEGAVEIAVVDTGIGIRPEDHDKLFVAFRQIDSGANRKFAGTGLGLSISLKLAQLLGGRVGMRSEHGKGSEFWCVLPAHLHAPPSAKVIAIPHQPQTPEALKPSPADDRDSLGLEDKTMLIVEDDPAFAEYVMGNCRAKGFKCLVANTGEAGLELARHYRPHAIILDINLPGISGLTVLSRLRENPVTKRIPVHVVSGTEFQIGADDPQTVGFLKKPVREVELTAAIDALDLPIAAGERRILVVAREDNDQGEIVRLIQREKASHRVATSGAAAMELLHSDVFDCVVMDLDLPDQRGAEVLKLVQQKAEERPMALIVLSAKELTAEEGAEIRNQAASVIVKGTKAKERLHDEVALFLHSVDAKLPGGALRILPAGAESSSLEGRRVLVVDDDMRNLFAVMSILEGQGVLVETATNGREALARLEDATEKFDLVLMDMMMPEMDGYEATKAIRGMERLKKIPVIALTARAMKGEREQCLAAGANDYLSKPLKIDQLLALIKLWIA